MAKIITITIKGTPFTYEDAELTRADSKPISELEGKQILEFTKCLFDQIGLNFYLCFGTLLGAIREKTIIKGDEDVDVFITDEELLYDNLPWLYEKGLHVIRCKRGKVYSFRMTGHIYIDVYVCRPMDTFTIWTPYCNFLNMNITPKRFFKNYQNIEFLGKTYQCPANPEKLLEFWYGKNWRTPIKEHSHDVFKYCEPSAYYWHRKGYYVKKILAHLIKK